MGYNRFVRFDFYRVNIVQTFNLKELQKIIRDDKELKQTLNAYIKEAKNEKDNKTEISNPFKLEELLMLIKSGVVRSDYRILDKLIELDVNTIRNEERNRNLYFFQFSNNRDTDIPPKKRIGGQKESLPLDDDEYIGEYMSILYDATSSVAMVQSNRYSVTTKQLGHFFSVACMEKNKNEQIKIDNKIIRFDPIIDPEKIEKVKKSKFYSKFRIKMADMHTGDKPSVYCINSTLKGVKGMGIDVTYSVDARKKDAISLDQEFIRNICDAASTKSDSETLEALEVVFKDDDGKSEAVNCLAPKMSTKIDFVIQRRQNISEEWMYDKMTEEYNSHSGRIKKCISDVRKYE